jgi:hypothetical protein
LSILHITKEISCELHNTTSVNSRLRREVRELNRKVLGIAVALLLAAMFVAPVFAKRKVAVTATQMGTGSGEEGWLVDHGIYQYRGWEGAGMVTLRIPGQTPLVGASSSVFSGKTTFTQEPPDPQAEGMTHLKMMWTFTGEGTTGTFEGQMQRKTIGVPVITHVEAHVVLQGTGNFEGQTLILSYEGPPPLQWEGFLITS